MVFLGNFEGDNFLEVRVLLFFKNDCFCWFFYGILKVCCLRRGGFGIFFIFEYFCVGLGRKD